MLSARRGPLRGRASDRDVVRYEPSPEAVLDVLVPRRHPGVYIRGAGGVLLQRAELPHERHGFRIGKRQGHAE